MRLRLKPKPTQPVQNRIQYVLHTENSSDSPNQGSALTLYDARQKARSFTGTTYIFKYETQVLDDETENLLTPVLIEEVTRW